MSRDRLSLTQRLVNAALAGTSTAGAAAVQLLTAGVLVALGAGRTPEQVRQLVAELLARLEGEARNRSEEAS